MQFFSRYSYIWKFEKEQEARYDLFVRASSLASLRLVTIITIFGMSVFLVIDFFKNVDFSIVLATRSCLLIVASLVMWQTFKKIGPGLIMAYVILLTLGVFASAMVTALYARMPSYYLTNLLFLIFVLVITASGLHLRYAFFLNLLCLLLFLLYTNYVHIDSFYYSQYPHLFLIFLYLLIVGIVLESRRRRSFLQFNDLMDQKRIVEDLNEQKNKIISILSHDVAAPMNSLSTILHLQSNGGMSESDLKFYFPRLKEQFNNVSLLLFGLVRWSRSQMEGFVLDKAAIDIVDQAAESLKLFHLQILEKGLELKLITDKSALVKVDEEMIRIALRNLISNAIKFARTGTLVQIKVFKNDKNNIVVSVTNQGDPIPSDMLSKLFSFQMPSRVDSKGEKGTGLGLALTAFFIRLNGGEIYLASSDEGGTTFCIEIPEAIRQPVPA